MVSETILTKSDLILPLFIKHGSNIKVPIQSMIGHYQLSVDNLSEEIHLLMDLGIESVLLFGIPFSKDGMAKDSYSDNGIIQQAIHTIKNIAPHMTVVTDVCCCEYTDHGHCGVLSDNTGHLDVDNDRTLALFAKQAISHAQAGADIIAPSGMMDGQVGIIRSALDHADFSHIPIMSYSAKYASALYGPFRQAAEGVPQFGDRKSYQMNPANGNEALREVALDLQEGADIVMVKPAHAYLDVIHRIKTKYPEVPLAAYHVSGEFAMIKAAAQAGWIDGEQAAIEILTGIKRAGADIIINYFSKEIAKLL
tara:strand:- start:24055 stop:24981 length:927 start_codon:yes stop_codon:yes gene_type:complete